MSSFAGSQVAPPSVERLYIIPLSPKAPDRGSGSVTRLNACATPSGPNETQGSEARSKAGLPEQRVVPGSAVWVQVSPALKLVVATLTLDPPSE